MLNEAFRFDSVQHANGLLIRFMLPLAGNQAVIPDGLTKFLQKSPDAFVPDIPARNQTGIALSVVIGVPQLIAHLPVIHIEGDSVEVGQRAAGRKPSGNFVNEKICPRSTVSVFRL
jgi:hypothetical protein